jgi:hypothetical protein
MTTLVSRSMPNPKKDKMFAIGASAMGDLLTMSVEGHVYLRVSDATFSNAGRTGISMGVTGTRETKLRADNFAVIAYADINVPSYTKDALPTNTLANSTTSLYRVNATASGGAATIYSVPVTITRTGLTIRNLKLRIYSDTAYTAFEREVSVVLPPIPVTVSTFITIAGDNGLPLTAIANGSSKYLDIVAYVSGVGRGDSLVTAGAAGTETITK